MPIFNILLTKGLSKEKQSQLYKEVAETIAQIQNCPIEAVSGYIVPLEMYQMGQGDNTWDKK